MPRRRVETSRTDELDALDIQQAIIHPAQVLQADLSGGEFATIRLRNQQNQQSPPPGESPRTLHSPGLLEQRQARGDVFTVINQQKALLSISLASNNGLKVLISSERVTHQFGVFRLFMSDTSVGMRLMLCRTEIPTSVTHGLVSASRDDMMLVKETK